MAGHKFLLAWASSARALFEFSWSKNKALFLMGIICRGSLGLQLVQTDWHVDEVPAVCDEEASTVGMILTPLLLAGVLVGLRPDI